MPHLLNFNPKASNIKLQTDYYYLQSRYYDPQICRFINADSFNYINTSSRISINAYAYCENDPINYVDPFGFAKTENPTEVIAKIIVLSIEIDGFTRFFESIMKQSVDINFDLNTWFDGLDDFSQELFSTSTLFFVTAYNHFRESFVEMISVFSVKNIVKYFVDDPTKIGVDLNDLKDLMPDFEITNLAPVVELLTSLVSVLFGKDDGTYTDWQTLVLAAGNAIGPILDIITKNKVPNGYSVAFDVISSLLEVTFKFINGDYI